MSAPDFGGLHVLTLESRRATEAAALIATYGGRPMVAPALREVLVVVSASLAIAATLPALPIVIAILFSALGSLGIGNGAVFQIVPQRFGGRMGLITGVVGAAGGLGGFFLPTLMGAAKDLTGSYASGLAWLAAAFVCGAVVLLELGVRWKAGWEPAMAKQSGIFCYRGFVRRLFAEEAI